MSDMVWLVLLLTAALQAQVTTPAQTPVAVAPDRFWCPMHPNIRSPVEGACPICRMTLVAIPPPAIGEYRMNVTQIPEASGRGLTRLALTILEPGSDRQPVSFVEVHERPLHLFIVGRDLGYFAHVHPDREAEGTFTVRHELPPGEYMLMADFLPVGGTPQMLQRAMVTPGFDVTRRGNASWPQVTADEVAVLADAGDVKVTLQAPDVRAGRSATIRFVIADARTGAPVTDLEPYLSAPAHALIASADLTYVTHGHPEGEDTRGPTVAFEVLMPTPGIYKVWLQVQRMGRVQTVPFVLLAK